MIKDQIVKVLEDITGIKNPQVEFSSNEEFGDYSSNIAMVNSKQKGNFLENIEWIVKNVKKKNYEEIGFKEGLPVGKLSPEVKKLVNAKEDLVYFKPRIYGKINGWWKYRVGHPEVIHEMYFLPLIINSPIGVYQDKNKKNIYLFAFETSHCGVLVIEVQEVGLRNEILTMFLLAKKRFKEYKYLPIKNSPPGRTRIPSLLALYAKKRKVAGARFPSLQESLLFYNRLEKESQGFTSIQSGFSLEYVIKRNPTEYAKEISDKFNQKAEKLGITAKSVGGFINFKLKKDILISNLIQIDSQKEDYGKSKIGNEKLAIVEYSSANIAKPFTVGHLRSTIIGDSVANILEYSGWKVLRDNHLGDWGTQFGKQIYAIKVWGKSISEDYTVKELVDLYVKFHEEAEKDKNLEDKAREWFKKLEDNDSEARLIWKKCIDWSYQEFDKIYSTLGIKFSLEFENGRGLGESFFEDKIVTVIKELESKKLLKTGEEGAKLVFFADEKYPPAMILKKDGTTLYHTRDLATDKYRKDKYNPDLIINEVGLEQALYFRQLFEMEKMLGWFDENQRVHLGHGLIRFKDGKMSTRKGNVIWMEDILSEAIEKAKKLGSEDNQTAKQVAIGALKYNDLKRDPKTEIVFDWDEILNMEGNSGPYLQYTIARCNSVVLKGRTLKPERVCEGPTLTAEELSVLRKLSQFQEIIAIAAKNYSPNVLCNYLYELASKFNTFYSKYRILESEEEKLILRLRLTSATAQVLKNGLKLLGIESPEKM